MAGDYNVLEGGLLRALKDQRRGCQDERGLAIPRDLERIAVNQMDYSEILPNLLVGSHPEVDEIDQLKSAGVTAILNLQTQEDFDYHRVDWPQMQAGYSEHGIEVQRVPIRDFVPALVTGMEP